MKTENTFFDFSITIKFIIKWWKPLFVVCFVAAVGGMVFSSPLFITPMFQASTKMFPATTKSVSSAVFHSSSFLEFGRLEDTERLLELLGSRELLEQVADELDLKKHYEFTKGTVKEHHQFLSEFSGNISTRRTRFGAVQIGVLDRDPEMAALIANTISSRLDSLIHQMRFGRAMQAKALTLENLEEERQRMRLFQDSLTIYMREGVFGIDYQAQMLSQQMAIDLSRNNQAGVMAIKDRLGNLGEAAANQIYYRTHIEHISHNIANLERRLIDKVADLETQMQYKFVIDEAIPPIKKFYPHRRLIVVLSVLGAGLTCLVFLMAYEILQAKGILSQLRESIKKELASK